MRRSKMIGGVVVGVMFAVLAAGSAQAVPTLGVATSYGYIGSTGQTTLDQYQDYFVDSFYIGTDATHGFVVGPSGSDLIIFTNLLNADIWLLTTTDVQVTNVPTIDGTALGLVPNVTGQFDGYTPQPYYGLNLGPVDSDWDTLPSSIFPGTYYALNVELAYSGTIDASQYFFAVADGFGSGYGVLSPNSRNGNTTDAFSPKTTSATDGHQVPEPATLLLLGSGLLGLGLIRRRKNG